MTTRMGLAAGATFAGLVTLVMLIAPVDLLGDLLDSSGDNLTAFLVRRYAGSASVGLLVFTVATRRHADPERAALLGLASWFGIQAVTAVEGVASGDVGGLVWLAVLFDPIIAVWFIALASRSHQKALVRARRGDSPKPR